MDKLSTINPVIGLLIGAVLTIFALYSQRSLSFVRNMTVGIILAILAIDLIPQSKSKYKWLNVLGISIGIIVVVLLFMLNQHRESGSVIEIIIFAILALLIGMILGVSTNADLILSITLGSMLMIFILTRNICVWLPTLILVLGSIYVGYLIGKKYRNTAGYYFINAAAVSILIWLIVQRLLVTNHQATIADIPIITFAVFIGFIIVWIFQ